MMHNIKMALTVETCCVPHLKKKGFRGRDGEQKGERPLDDDGGDPLPSVVYCPLHEERFFFYILYASSPSYIYQRETASLVCIIYSVEKNNLLRKKPSLAPFNPGEGSCLLSWTRTKVLIQSNFNLISFGNMSWCVLRFHLSIFCLEIKKITWDDGIVPENPSAASFLVGTGLTSFYSFFFCCKFLEGKGCR